jgi:hypothetical protein
MTKAELLAAIVAAPDLAIIYVDQGNGMLRSHVTVDVDVDDGGAGTIIISYDEAPEDEDEDEEDTL